MPPLTVASLATMSTSRPETRPMPVTMPAPGASSSYMPQAASGESSRNGEPGSMQPFDPLSDRKLSLLAVTLEVLLAAALARPVERGSEAPHEIASSALWFSR